MIDNFARQHGLVCPIQPAYQTPPQHFNSNSSHVHYSFTFDKGNPTSYPPPADNSIHNPHDSLNTNDLAKEYMELRDIISSLLSPQKKAAFLAKYSPYSNINTPSNEEIEELKMFILSDASPQQNAIFSARYSSLFSPHVPNLPCNPPYCEPHPNPLPIVPPSQNPHPVITLSYSPPTTSTTLSPKSPTT